MGDLQPLAGGAGLSTKADCRGRGAEEGAVHYLGARVLPRGGVRVTEGRREEVNYLLPLCSSYKLNPRID